MKHSRSVKLIALFAVVLMGAREPVEPQANRAGRFETVEVFVDSGERPLAAYQLDLRDPAGAVTIVGIEGGQAPAFHEAPYYDPKAMQSDRVILAAYSLGDAGALPVGRVRVATIHVLVAGDAQPAYRVELTAAATADGTPIRASVHWRKGSEK